MGRAARLGARLAVFAAAERWWRMHRPLGWTEAEHLEHPEINCATDAEHALARAVGQVVKEERKKRKANASIPE